MKDYPQIEFTQDADGGWTARRTVEVRGRTREEALDAMARAVNIALWQPLSSAPLTDDYIMLAGPGWLTVAHRQSDRDWPWVDMLAVDGVLPGEPTGWMPMPPAPFGER